MFLYEGGEIDDTSNNETSPQQTENAIIGFDDGFNNSWMPRTIANNIGNRIGNVPPRRGVYVLDFNISKPRNTTGLFHSQKCLFM